MSGYADIDTLAEGLGPRHAASSKKKREAHAALSRVREALQAADEFYEQAMSAWDEDDIRPESSYAQSGGLIRARTADGLRAALRAVRGTE